MIKFTDPFGRLTIVEVLPSSFNKRVGFQIRRERQSIAESFDLETAKALRDLLSGVIIEIEKL